MPASTDPQASLAVLAAYPDMPAIFHRFARDAADATIIDTSGDFMPTDLAWGAATNVISQFERHNLSAEPFVLSRVIMRFLPSHIYAIVATPTGPAGLDAARPQDVPQAWSALGGDVAAECAAAPYLFVLTTTRVGEGRHGVSVEMTPGDEIECQDTSAPPFTRQSACDHPYLPLREGATWTYAWTNGRSFTWRVTAVAGDAQRASARVTRTELAGGQTEYVWTCHAGIGMYRTVAALTLGDGVSARYRPLEVTGRFLPPALLLSPGAEWGFQAVMRGDAEGARHGPLTAITIDQFRLLGRDPVTLDGQGLPGLQIDQQGSEVISAVPGLVGPPIPYHYVVELAQDVGIVRRGDFETLVSYSIPE
jgi:hypothetical protein